MKNWNETRETIEEAWRLLSLGAASAIVVLTHVKGSAYRRPGAKLLIRPDGTMLGNVSGGCLENDLRERALAAIDTGKSASVHYQTGSDEDAIWGLGLGCDGELDLMIYPHHTALHSSWINQALRRMKTGEPFALHWPLENREQAWPSLHGADDSGDTNRVFVDLLVPPPDLFVVGAGDDAILLVRLASMAGMRVTVIDHRAANLETGRFPDARECRCIRPEAAASELTVRTGSLVIIKNHALEMDKKWAGFFDASPASYIGILGPKKRCAEIRALMTRGSPDRVFGPAGLDIGSEGAEQIAMSIVSEMLAVCAARQPTHLRDRPGSIH